MKVDFITKVSSYLEEMLIPKSHSVIVNACFHKRNGHFVHRNWGDDINKYFIEQLFGCKVISYYHSSRSIRKKAINYMMIGSTINMQHNEETIIWGSGVIDPNVSLKTVPNRILAVRGPLTRRYLLENGVSCPEIYGDPALLIAKYYHPKVVKRYKLGIIPHYSDVNNPQVQRLVKQDGVILIHMEGYKHWLDVIDQICSCEVVASSSLHGLIMSEAYDVPNVWFSVSDLIGGTFKFHDFFLSLGKDRIEPLKFSESTTINSILVEANHWEKGFIDLGPLINAAPFEISIKEIIKDGRKQ